MEALLPKVVMLLPYIGIAIVTLFASDLVLSLRERFKASDQIVAANSAVGFRRLGLFLGTMIGLSGVLAGEADGNLVVDLANTGIYALLLIVMMQLALWVNDTVILPHVANSAAVKDGNQAVAVTEVGSMVATGFIAQGAIEGANAGFLPVLAFFALGQVALVLLTLSFSLIHRKCNLVREVETGNVAAGIIMASKFWAYGLIISIAAGGPFTGWTTDLETFAVTAAVGLVFLYVASWLVDFVLIRWHTLEQMVTTKSVPSSLVFAGGQVGMAYAVSVLVF